jgi:arylsulfatase A-like enzyme
MLAGDNGWFLGEHGFTSKVLPYEESIRIPLLAAGPGAARGAVRDELVLNADIAATILDLARAGPPAGLHGRSFAALLRGEREPGWRDAAYYEALRPELGTRPTRALRTRKRKCIQTLDERTRSKVEFEELYDLERDPGEMNNLASRPESAAVLDEMKARLSRHAATL